MKPRAVRMERARVSRAGRGIWSMSDGWDKCLDGGWAYSFQLGFKVDKQGRRGEEFVLDSRGVGVCDFFCKPVP